MQTIDMDWGNIIIGLRIEDTEYETVGQKLVGSVAEPLTVKQSYTNVLPNAHVNWDFKDDQKLRFSFFIVFPFQIFSLKIFWCVRTVLYDKRWSMSGFCVFMF